MHKHAIIWFNGPSSREFLAMPKVLPEIGCNYIYRVRAVDHVVCYDWEMLKSVPAGPYQRWCRNGVKHPDFQEITYVMTEQPQQSGLLALHLAIKLGYEQVYVLGCDWGVSNKSIFEYDGKHPAPIKYSNSAKRVMNTLSQRIAIKIVHRSTPDVNVPLLSADRFLADLASLT